MTEDELHIGMWQHYDKLRQEKNKTFLTANTILAGVIGLSWKDGAPLHPSIVFIVCLLGLIVCVLWILLLSRNAAYIKFHRGHLSDLEAEWERKKPELLWFPRLSSTLFDRFLAGFFGLFYVAVSMYFLALTLCKC